MVSSIYHVDKITSQNPQNIILAAIDIGTNSVHMVVVDIDPTLPCFRIIAREKDTVRLGERDPKTGNLTQEAMNRAIGALQRCKDLAASLKVNYTIAVATSATREASNGCEFLQRIDKEVGIGVDLISGQEEARRIYLGVLSGMDFHHHPHVLIDIGGGSTELILADSQEAKFLNSTKVGAVRLTQDFITTDPISPSELAGLKAYIRGMLERPVEHILALSVNREIPHLVGTSGTIETLAIIHALSKGGNVPNPLHGYQFSRRDLREILNSFVGLSYQERLQVPGMSDKRAEIIIAGGMILLEAMTMLNLDNIIMCERALREGMIVDWMLSHGLIESRLGYQSQVRQRSVMKIARKYEVNLTFAKRVADFSVSIFEQTKGKLHHWGEDYKELLYWSAILHNSGLHISHGAHHKHSYYLIRHGELLGFTERELEIMANLARYHRKSKPKKKHENYNNLVDKDDRTAVNQLSAILRVAVALDRRQIGAILRLECAYDPEYRELHLHLTPALDDECSLELWSLDYKKTVFEEEFGVKLIATLALPLVAV